MGIKGQRFVVYAGTTEGRRIIDFLLTQGAGIHACVATEYGESLLPDHENLRISHKRQDVEEMKRLFRDFSPDYVIDATHPYAQVVTENIKKACRESGNENRYLRLLREESEDSGDLQPEVVWMDSVPGAVEYLQHTKGNILATTGSKELEAYTKLSDYKERLYARVLSVKNVVDKCDELGIMGRHLICMQGPFSLEMNKAMLRDFQISYMVTKESGSIGGFEEKRQAALETDTVLIVVGRPHQEEGYSYEKLREYLLQQNK